MGRLVDIDALFDYIELCTVKDIYTKADVVAMLEKLQAEIDEKATDLCDDGWWLTYNNLIQQKINSLKAESEDKE